MFSHPPTPPPARLHTSYDTHLCAYLWVHGPVEDLAVADPDDWGCRFGVVGMTGQVEGVTGPQAHHGSSADDWVVWRNYRQKKGMRLLVMVTCVIMNRLPPENTGLSFSLSYFLLAVCELHIKYAFFCCCCCSFWMMYCLHTSLWY